MCARSTIESAEEATAVRLTLRGRVQGIGLRPALARWAAECGVFGSVRNTLGGVLLHAEGTAADVERFVAGMGEHLPSAAGIESCGRETVEAAGATSFVMDERGSSEPAAVRMPRDVAICGACLRDVANANNRRFGYPLATCAACGPRYSIVTSLPFSRGATSMGRFALCGSCGDEFRSAGDRRFHAETIACGRCGPQMWLAGPGGRMLGGGDDAIALAAEAVVRGEIVAMRGVGGYQLVCDATQESAVARLRVRKRRTKKPLAMMVLDVVVAESFAVFDDAGRRVLESGENPIVVARRRNRGAIAMGVGRELSTVGLMLPTTAAHWLLLERLRRPIVATSGNVEGEPLAVTAEEAETRLAGIADVFLHHDRPIVRPVDDSVVRVIGGRPVTLRLARGMAPAELAIGAENGPAGIAVGGHQKSAVAVANGSQAVLGPHVGNLETVSNRERFEAAVDDLRAVYRSDLEWIAHDAHPDYFTTRYAESRGPATMAVQHHHAHVVAGMIEHGWLDREVLGVAFDGTGWGPDGTIWGGEILRATATGYRRVARLRPFPLAGGDAAVREPWRVGLALAAAAIGHEAALGLPRFGLHRARGKRLMRLCKRSGFVPWTSSAGRLFDGVAALVLGVDVCDYEAEAAIRLEDVCDADVDDGYAMRLCDGEPGEIDWRSAIREIVADLERGKSPGRIAARFHYGLAAAALAVCRKEETGCPIVLGGGVFQNRVLVEAILSQRRADDGPLGLPGTIPPGDGGLAAGQLAVAMATRDRGEVAACV